MQVKDFRFKGRSLQSIPVVCEFLEVLSDILPGVSPDKDINFGVDILLEAHLISIPLSRITPTELKELKK